MTGAPDDKFWRVVQREGMCLFTADKGFANAQVFPPGTHGGIVLLPLPRESRAGYIHLTGSLLESVNVESAVGSIVAVTPAVESRAGTVVAAIWTKSTTIDGRSATQHSIRIQKRYRDERSGERAEAFFTAIRRSARSSRISPDL